MDIILKERNLTPIESVAQVLIAAIHSKLVRLVFQRIIQGPALRAKHLIETCPGSKVLELESDNRHSLMSHLIKLSIASNGLAPICLCYINAVNPALTIQKCIKIV